MSTTLRIGDGAVDIPLPAFVPSAGVLPRGWEAFPTPSWQQRFGKPAEGYVMAYRWRKPGITVLVSCAQYRADHSRWLHVSVSRKDGVLPTWEQMCTVKDMVIGPERQAIQVMPPADKYVNIHPGVLHLWHALDGDGLPDFTGGGESI